MSVRRALGGVGVEVAGESLSIVLRLCGLCLL